MKIQKWRLKRDILKICNGEEVKTDYAKRCLEALGYFDRTGKIWWGMFASDYWFREDLARNNWRHESCSRTTSAEWREQHAQNFLFLWNLANEINQELKLKQYRFKYSKTDWRGRRVVYSCKTVAKTLQGALQISISQQGIRRDRIQNSNNFGQNSFKNTYKIHSIKEIGNFPTITFQLSDIRWPELKKLVDIYDKL